MNLENPDSLSNFFSKYSKLASEIFNKNLEEKLFSVVHISPKLKLMNEYGEKLKVLLHK